MENIIKAGVVVYAALFLNVGAAVAGKDCTNTCTYVTIVVYTAGLDENAETPNGMAIVTKRRLTWM